MGQNNRRLFSEAQEAYKVLHDPAQRALYDEARRQSFRSIDEFDELERQLEVQIQKVNKLESELFQLPDHVKEAKQAVKYEKLRRERAEDALRIAQKELDEKLASVRSLQIENTSITRELDGVKASLQKHSSLVSELQTSLGILQRQIAQQQVKKRIWQLTAGGLGLFLCVGGLYLSITQLQTQSLNNDKPKILGVSTNGKVAVTKSPFLTSPVASSLPKAATSKVITFTPPYKATITGVKGNGTPFVIAVDFEIYEAVVTTRTTAVSATIELKARITRTLPTPHLWPPDLRPTGYLIDKTKDKYKLTDANGFLTGTHILTSGVTLTGSLIFLLPVLNEFQLVDPHIKINKSIAINDQ